MTELRELSAAIAFLDLAPLGYDTHRDVAKLRRIQKHYCVQGTELDVLSMVRAFIGFNKALVNGINCRVFRFETNLFKSKKSFAYPRIFSGLMASIFAPDGTRLDDWSRDAFEILTQTLAFFKRVNLPALQTLADEAAVEDFAASQTDVKPFVPMVARMVRKLWKEFAKDLPRYAKLGFPGPGATLDETYPYCPQYSYLDTWDPTLPDDIRGFYDHAFSKGTGFPDSRSWTLHPGDQLVPGLYRFIKDPVLNATCVPKNSLVSRLITINNVGNVIIGATYRDSLKAVWKHRKIEHQLNVHRQDLSHTTLMRHFDITSYVDIQGGTNCFSNDYNLFVVTDYFRDFLMETSNSKWRINGREGAVKTQLMGDSISVAILTTNMYLCTVLAYFFTKYSSEIKRVRALRRKSRRRFKETFGKVDAAELLLTPPFIRRLFDECRELPIHWVGDDGVFPSELEDNLRHIFKMIGVTVNEAKSSKQDAVHKETCGCWAIKEPDGSLRRIFPWRFPSGTTIPEQLQAATQFLQRSAGSKYILQLTIALSEIYGPLLTNESYHPEDIGSPVGTGLPFKSRSISRPSTCRISDTSAYLFNVRDGALRGTRYVSTASDQTIDPPRFATDAGVSAYRELNVQFNKRPPAVRTRYVPFLDPSAPRPERKRRRYTPKSKKRTNSKVLTPLCDRTRHQFT